MDITPAIAWLVYLLMVVSLVCWVGRIAVEIVNVLRQQ